MRHWKLLPRRAALGASAVCLIAIGLLPGPAAAANAAITFGVTLRSPGECIFVYSVAESPTDVTLRNAAGDIKAQGTLPADESFFCLPGSTWVDGGDTIKASDATDARTLRVPNLSIEVDRVNNKYLGAGPAGRTVVVEYPQGFMSDVGLERSVRVGQDGTWSLNPHHDLLWGLDGAVTWNSPKGDRLTAYGFVPYITLTIGKSTFSGRTTAMDAVEPTLQDGQTASGSAVADFNGAYAGKLRNANGRAVKVSVGDRLLAPGLGSDADWIVPGIQATTNAATDVVSGVCGDAGALTDWVKIDVVRLGHVRGNFILGWADNGSFSVDFGGKAHPGFHPTNIKTGDTIVVGCMLTTGDWVQRQFKAQ